MSENDKGKAARAAFLQGNADRMADNAAAAREEAQKNRPPVVCLGMEGNNHVLYSPRNKRLHKRPAEKIGLAALREIASLDKWASFLFPERVSAGDEVRKGELMEAAQEWIFERSGCRSFDVSCVRSRGVWRDNAGGWLYNAGASCWHIPASGGKPLSVDNVRVGHVYQSGVEIPAPGAELLTDAEGALVVELLTARPWLMDGAGDLLAGWVVAGMLAGSMPVCPHIWVNAPAGTGKTFLKDDISAILGAFSMRQEGVPTDAGVRQRLNGDAIPVLIDEVEQGGSETAGKRISNLLDLMRSASYGKDPITKGGSDGTPRLYPVKCGFVLFSIINCLIRAADSSRCIVLRLYRREKGQLQEVWKRQDPGRALVHKPAFLRRLISRLLDMLPVLMENIRTLTAYLRGLDGVDSRQGELFAVLIACRFALTSAAPLTPEQMKRASVILRAYNEQDEAESDTARCLAVLLGHQVDVYGAGRMSVSQACRTISTACAGEAKDAYARALELAGLVWQDDGNEVGLLVDARAIRMKAIYTGTQWASGQVSAVLAEGAKRGAGAAGANKEGIYYKSKRMKAGHNPVACVFIPAALVI